MSRQRRQRLLELARHDDLDGVKRLVQQCTDVNIMNCCKEAALYVACKNGYTELAQYLLENGAWKEYTYGTPIKFCAWKG